jgi:hypothetical protein
MGVHSNVQIIASVEFGGSAVLQFSQAGLSSSISIARLMRKPPGIARRLQI